MILVNLLPKQICTKCKVAKPATKFAPDVRRRLKIESMCHDCKGEITKAWAERNPESKNKYLQMGRDRRANLKAKAISVLGCKCNHCGISDERVLQFDHVNDDGASDRSDYGKGTERTYRMVIEHPSRFQLLCANCHMIKSYDMFRKRWIS